MSHSEITCRSAAAAAAVALALHGRGSDDAHGWPAAHKNRSHKKAQLQQLACTTGARRTCDGGGGGKASVTRTHTRTLTMTRTQRQAQHDTNRQAQARKEVAALTSSSPCRPLATEALWPRSPHGDHPAQSRGHRGLRVAQRTQMISCIRRSLRCARSHRLDCYCRPSLARSRVLSHEQIT